MRAGINLEVSAADREQLAAVAADRNSRQKHVWRARFILATAAGCGTAEIMRRAGVSKPCVWRWQERFMREGVAGLLHDKTRKPGLLPLPSALVDRVVKLTLAEPPGEATHWTGRAMAAACGLSLRSVQRIWGAHGLQPYRVRRFKLSQDPAFAAKLRDVVGLYLDPPAHSLGECLFRYSRRLASASASRPCATASPRSLDCQYVPRFPWTRFLSMTRPSRRSNT